MTGMQDAIQIYVNGQARAWRIGLTVADLLQDLEIKTEKASIQQADLSYLSNGFP